VKRDVLKVHPDDDMLVALVDHRAGQSVECDGTIVTLTTDVAAKHKFAVRAIASGEPLRMYGVTVGRATQPIAAGERITTANLVHHTDAVTVAHRALSWSPPDVSRWSDRTFAGYRRSDGRVGTANHWLVVPLVFCENRNLRVIRDAMLEELGYERNRTYQSQVRRLIELHREGASPRSIIDTTSSTGTPLSALCGRWWSGWE